MLAEERHALILDLVNQQGNVKLTELCSRLHASQSTIRRDLLELSEQGLLTKVHGGAISRNERFFPVEHNMEEKANLYIAEKTAIARYAASLLEEGDFVYLDAGTTTEKVIDFIPLKKITFVTNGFLHAKRLAQRGFQVYIPAGAVKAATEAIIGAECVLSLQSYNFTKCLMGVNGISLTAGLSTPDKGEASVKKAAIQASLFSGRPLQIRPDFSHYLCTPERRADYYRPASRPEIPFGSHDSGGFVNDLYRYF